MLRRLHLILAALAMLVAPLAMQSGMAMAAMPMEHREVAQSGHCGDEDSGSEDEPAASERAWRARTRSMSFSLTMSACPPMLANMAELEV